MPATHASTTRPSRVSDSPAIPDAVRDWVNGLAELMEPESLHYCDGSPEEAQVLTRLLVEQGTLHALDPVLRPNSYVARSEPSDVARVEARTFICSRKEEDAGPPTTGKTPVSMRKKLQELSRGEYGRANTLRRAFFDGSPRFASGAMGRSGDRFGLCCVEPAAHGAGDTNSVEPHRIRQQLGEMRPYSWRTSREG